MIKKASTHSKRRIYGFEMKNARDYTDLKIHDVHPKPQGLLTRKDFVDPKQAQTEKMHLVYKPQVSPFWSHKEAERARDSAGESPPCVRVRPHTHTHEIHRQHVLGRRSHVERGCSNLCQTWSLILPGIL